LRSLEKAKIEGRRHLKRWVDGKWEPNTCYRSRAEPFRDIPPIESTTFTSPHRQYHHLKTEDKQTTIFSILCIQLRMQNSFQWRRSPMTNGRILRCPSISVPFWVTTIGDYQRKKTNTCENWWLCRGKRGNPLEL